MDAFLSYMVPTSKAMLLLLENGEIPEFSKEPEFYEKIAEKRRGTDLEKLFAFEGLELFS